MAPPSLAINAVSLGDHLRAVLCISFNTYPGFPSYGGITVSPSVFDNAKDVFAERSDGNNGV